MYDKKNLTYILTILESIEKIYIYAQDIRGADEFYTKNDQMNFNACQILLLVIGEDSKKISDALKAEHPNIPWHLISGLRNRIAHDYRSIDPNLSFDIIQNYLADLKDELLFMLDKLEYERELLEKAVNTTQYSHLRYLLAEK